MQSAFDNTQVIVVQRRSGAAAIIAADEPIGPAAATDLPRPHRHAERPRAAPARFE
jgi:hypothetical protein